MTVASQTTKVSYSGNGSTTTFTVPFYFLDNTHLKVTYRNNTTGTETVKTLTTDYTVSGAGNVSGGSVTMLSAPASGISIVIQRNVPLTQEVDYQPNDPFPAQTHEMALDKLTMESQQIQEQVSRSIKISTTNTMTSTEFTVGATDRANKVLGFDAAGELSVAQELGTYRGSWSSGVAYSQRDLIKDTTNSNIYICQTAHTSSGSLPISTNTDAAKWALIVDAAAAASSASSAASSASAAATSASDAATSASNAASSASSASTSATNAATSASSASTSAGTATTQAANAASSATSASGSATAAATSATNAASSATAASGSASTASTAATNASNSASAASTSATNAAASATSASGSATTATTQASNASNSASSASTSATNAASSASAAATSATNAASSATAASASAAAAAASAASGLYRQVLDKSANYTITSSDGGTLFRANTGSGAITFTLPQISTVTDGFKAAIVKWTSDANVVNINRSGTDTINGATSVQIGSQYSQVILVADFETNTWFASQSGLGATNMNVDVFSGNGSTTAFTLTADPGSKNNTNVYISGVHQDHSTYSVSGTTLTFSTAPPSGSSNIEVNYGTPLPTGTPGDGTVTIAKLSATGTPSASTYLRGDNTWSPISASQWTTNVNDIYYNTGNVGIGTSSPGRRLDVQQASVDYQMRIGDGGGVNYYDIGRSTTNGFLTFYGSQSGANGYVFTGVDGELARINSSGNFYFNSGYGSVATAYGCRAWVTFNGSSILASGNVSSITVNGTGEYTINFTTAMPDSNYSIAGAAQCYNTGSPNLDTGIVGYRNGPGYINTSNVRVSVQQNSSTGGGGFNAVRTSVAVFR